MESLRLLAFAVDWWIEFRDVDPVRGAFRRTDVEHWGRLIEETLKSNKKLGRSPSTQAALADRLGRHASNLIRVFMTGKSEASVDDLRSIAMILDLPVTAFWMSNRDRIAKAARILCVGGANLGETMAYVIYRETGSRVEDSRRLDERCLREVLKIVQQIRTIQDAESSIWKVARCLESSLKEAQDYLWDKQERKCFAPNCQGTKQASTQSPRRLK
jgi:hypothetical protein